MKKELHSQKSALCRIPTLKILVRKAAFTLAEVLITLGIIGVVAALTMPSLISKYKTHEASTRLKKFYSMINQAILMSENDNGEITTWDKRPEIFNDDGTQDINANEAETYRFVSKYIAPYLKHTELKKGSYTPPESGEETHNSTQIKLTDGTTIMFWNGSCIDILVDINGEKNPNLEGRDQYRFMTCPLTMYMLNNKKIGTYLDYETPDRITALNRCKENPVWCTNVLLYDNFEFKEDYPYKL